MVNSSHDDYGTAGIVQLTRVVFLTVPNEANDVLKRQLPRTARSLFPSSTPDAMEREVPCSEGIYISAPSAHWKRSSQENKRNVLARPCKPAHAHKTHQSSESAFIPLLVTMLGFRGQWRAYVHEDPRSLSLSLY